MALTLYNTFDSRPPNPDADSNDVGAEQGGRPPGRQGRPATITRGKEKKRADDRIFSGSTLATRGPSWWMRRKSKRPRSWT